MGGTPKHSSRATCILVKDSRPIAQTLAVSYAEPRPLTRIYHSYADSACHFGETKLDLTSLHFTYQFHVEPCLVGSHHMCTSGYSDGGAAPLM